MDPSKICEQIENAGAWLPITTVRQAFIQEAALTPVLLQAVSERASSNSLPISRQRLAAFGVFFLGQHRDRRIFDPLIQLFESVDSDYQDEWLFGNRLFFFGHRLLAGICQQNPERPTSLALDMTKAPMTRTLANSAIGLQAAYGDITRAEAVYRLRTAFKSVEAQANGPIDACWALTATKLQSRAFESELQWFLTSGRLAADLRPLIAAALQQHPDENFVSICDLDGMFDLFRSVFPSDLRDGEVGLLPNGQIPDLDMYAGSLPQPRTN